MKLVAILALCCGMAAALAGAIVYGIRIVTGKISGKWSVGILVFCVLFVLIAAANLFLVIKFL